MGLRSRTQAWANREPGSERPPYEALGWLASEGFIGAVLAAAAFPFVWLARRLLRRRRPHDGAFDAERPEPDA